MAIETKTTLKGHFETGDIPTQAQFENLIDSLIHQNEDNAAVEAAYNNQVSVVSQADAEAGTSTEVKRWTPERVGQAIAALSGGGGGGGGTSNYPFANETLFTGYTWIKDYVLDVEIIEATSGSIYKTDGSLKRFRFSYLTNQRIWIEADNDAGTAWELVCYIINGSTFGSEITWVEIDQQQSSSGIEARVKINPDVTGSMSNVQNELVSQIEPMVIKRANVPTIPPNGNPQFPFDPDANFSSLGNMAYIKDVKLIFDDASKRFKSDGTFRKFWLGYGNISTGTARLFIYGENDAGDGSELFGYILETSFVNPGDVWFYQSVPDPNTSGVRASIYMNWNNIDSSGGTVNDFATTGLDEYIVRLGATSSAGSNQIFKTNYRSTSTDTNGQEAIKDIRVIGKEDQGKEIAVTFIAKNDSTLGNAIGFQIRHKNVWRKYCVFSGLTDPGNSTTWIECDYDDIPAGEIDHYSDTLKIKFKIDFSAISDGVNYLWGASNYVQEPNYLLSNRIFDDDEYSGLTSFLQYWEQRGNSDYGDFNELLETKDINLIINNADRLPSGSTRPASVEIGMVWLDNSGSASDPTIKIRVS